MRSFYLIYSKGQTVSDEFTLSWSHYLNLMRIDDLLERRIYEIEAYKNNWSLRELQRQYDSALYARLTLSRDQKKVRELSEQGLILEKPKDAIKDPYVLEFIGLPEKSFYSESELEQKLIDKLEHFLLELGTGFKLILCQNKSEAVVEYTLPENNEQIFASKYQTVLPSKEELRQLIEDK